MEKNMPRKKQVAAACIMDDELLARFYLFIYFIFIFLSVLLRRR